MSKIYIDNYLKSRLAIHSLHIQYTDYKFHNKKKVEEEEEEKTSRKYNI